MTLCTLLRFSLVKRYMFWASSHIRWWLLKSPSHSTCDGPLLDFPAQPLHPMYCTTMCKLSELVLSLYMLITTTSPIFNQICMDVVSDGPVKNRFSNPTKEQAG